MNYKIYKDSNEITEKIVGIVNKAFENPKESIYSEVIVILDNDNIKNQIEEIKNKFSNNEIISVKEYFYPFIIIIYPEEIKLDGFLKSKIFHYKISLKDIYNCLEEIKNKQIEDKKEENKIEKKEEISNENN